MTCAVCGGERACHPTGGHVGDIEFLSADDWRQIYEFSRDVQLPFMHRVIARAAARNGIQFTRWRKSRREITKREFALFEGREAELAAAKQRRQLSGADGRGDRIGSGDPETVPGVEGGDENLFGGG